MKIKSTISYSSFLMIVLIFSQPVIILAQQNSVEVQAKIDAERDATTDVNKLLWTGVGCAAPFFSLLGCIAGANAVSNDSGNDLGSAIGNVIIGGGVGFLVGTSIPIVPIYTYRLSPLPERLIGKSSEYVDFYTDAYKTKTKRLRGESVAIGALVGAGCMIILLRVLDK